MPIQTYDETVQWLHRFGYLDTLTPTEEQHNEAVRQMQEVYELKVDADAGPITRRAMGLFRCAHRDNIAFLRSDAPRWTKPVINYWFASNFVFNGKRNPPREIIKQGFDLYEPLTGLKFREVEDVSRADIKIAKGKGKKFGFDGVGNVLAWAEMPESRNNEVRHMMFDEDEPWSLFPNAAGVYLLAVWTHELGHLVGLDHSRNSKDLMAPYYNARVTVPQTGDIAQLAKLYEQPLSVQVDGTTQAAIKHGAYAVTGSMVVRENGTPVIDLTQVKPI